MLMRGGNGSRLILGEDCKKNGQRNDIAVSFSFLTESILDAKRDINFIFVF